MSGNSSRTVTPVIEQGGALRVILGVSSFILCTRIRNDEEETTVRATTLEPFENLYLFTIKTMVKNSSNIPSKLFYLIHENSKQEETIVRATTLEVSRTVGNLYLFTIKTGKKSE